MKNVSIYILGGLLLILSGCLKEEENLFSEPAAVRLNNAIKGVDSVLTQSSNGWVMQYFADSVSPGYSLLVNFGKNGEAKVAANNQLFNNTYTEDKSSFDVIGDNGPVLTFNTYNNVLHLFSNPANPAGIGLGGDYEFVVKSYSDSLIYLNGKKHGAKIRMNRLDKNIIWRSYFDSLNQLDNEIMGSGTLYLVSGSDVIEVVGGVSHVFEFLDTSESGSTVIPFIITADGLRLYSAYTTSTGKKVQTFYLNKDGDRLISREDAGTYFRGPSVVHYFIESHRNFIVDTTQTSNHFLQPMRVVSQKLKERYSGRRNFDYMAFSYNGLIGNTFMISTAPTVTPSNYKLSLSASTSIANQMVVTKVNDVCDSNGELFITAIPEIDILWSAMEGTYQLSSTISLNKIKFVDKNDHTRFFTVIKK